MLSQLLSTVIKFNQLLSIFGHKMDTICPGQYREID